MYVCSGTQGFLACAALILMCSVSLGWCIVISSCHEVRQPQPQVDQDKIHRHPPTPPPPQTQIYECCRGCCEREALVLFWSVRLQVPFAAAPRTPSSCYPLLIRHPGLVQLAPHYERIVWKHIKGVMDDDQGQAFSCCSHEFHITGVCCGCMFFSTMTDFKGWVIIDLKQIFVPRCGVKKKGHSGVLAKWPCRFWAKGKTQVKSKIRFCTFL